MAQEKLHVHLFAVDILKKPKAKVLLIPHFKDDSRKDSLFHKVDQILKNRLSKRAKELGIKFKLGEKFSLSGAESLGYESVYVFGVGDRSDLSPARFQQALADALRAQAAEKYTSVAMELPDVLGKDRLQQGKMLSESLHLSQYNFLKYKSKKEREKVAVVSDLYVYASETNKNQADSMLKDLNEGVEMGRVISEGVCLARDLVNEPGLTVKPIDLTWVAQEIGRESHGAVDVKVLGKRECEKLGMGAFLAVARGSHTEPQFILLHYKGASKKKAKGTKSNICLIGKAITFDSGGLSLKPWNFMTTMKLDMAGGAAVLGVFKILSRLHTLDREVFGIIPACENMPGGNAIKPGDVVKTLSGKTVEVLNTDAEGRMVLADGICYAEKYLKPDYIIDLATLTGSIMVALGEEIAGMFASDDGLAEAISTAAQSQGEELWRMPLYKTYLKSMKSSIADLTNTEKSRYGGAITAALFLQAFVDRAKWSHLDIAGVAFNEEKPKGLLPVGGTGWGVRTLLELLNSDKI